MIKSSSNLKLEIIFISSILVNQHLLVNKYNPQKASETLKTAEDVSLAQGFMIRSHGERSLIFRLKDSYIEYQDLGS